MAELEGAPGTQGLAELSMLWGVWSSRKARADQSHHHCSDWGDRHHSSPDGFVMGGNSRRGVEWP
jgi:hypothetical protein